MLFWTNSSPFSLCTDDGADAEEAGPDGAEADAEEAVEEDAGAEEVRPRRETFTVLFCFLIQPALPVKVDSAW